MKSRHLKIMIVLALLVGLSACAAPEESSSNYAPGLGEIMTFTQMRHTKLWLAGEASNWELAAYEVDELEEGFQDAVTYHPTHKDAPVALTTVLPAMTDAPIAALRVAIGKRDRQEFEAAFDSLTAGCNNCHHTMKFAFNVVQRPTFNAFPNQNFSAPGIAP
jgi:cytochrome c553